MLNASADLCGTVLGQENPPRRVFGHISLPRALIGTRIGGNASYKPPGAS